MAIWDSGTSQLDGSEVGKVLSRVDFARKRRQRLEQGWIENVRYLNNDFYNDLDPTMDRVSVNTFQSTARSIIPALYFKDPDALVEPKREQDVNGAPILEAALNYWVPRIKTKKVVHRMIPDALCYPWAVCKLGYVTEDKTVSVKVHKKTGKVQYKEDSELVDLSEFSIESRPFLIGRRPVLERISPRAFLVDPRATDLDDADWICEEVVRHVDEVKSDPMYSNTKGLSPNARYRPTEAYGSQYYGVTPGDLRSSTESGPYEESGEYRGQDWDDLVRLYQFWDRRNRKLIVVAPGYDKFLRNDNWPYLTENYLYFTLCLGVQVPDELYPVPLLSIIKSQQIELNKIRSYQLDFIKRAVTRYLIDDSLADKQTLDAIRRGERVPLVPVKGNPNEIVKILEAASMGEEVPRAELSVKDDIRVTTGTAEFQRATVTPSRSTATEQRLIAQSTSLTIEWGRDQVSDLIVNICNGLRDLLQQFADVPQMVKVSGRADFEWKQFTKDDILGDYDVTIRAGSQLPIDREVRKKNFLDFFNLTAPIALQTGKVNFDELLRHLAQEFEIVDPERLLNVPEEDRPPADVEMEEALLANGGTPRAAPSDDPAVHIPRHIQGLQRATDAQDQWRRKKHIQQHIQLEVMKQQAQMMAAQGMDPNMQAGGPPMPGAPAPGGPGPQAGPPGPGGPPPGMPMGMGRPNVTPGMPMNPRQFSERAPNNEQMSRAASRSGP